MGVLLVGCGRLQCAVLLKRTIPCSIPKGREARNQNQLCDWQHQKDTHQWPHQLACPALLADHWAAGHSRAAALLLLLVVMGMPLRQVLWRGRLVGVRSWRRRCCCCYCCHPLQHQPTLCEGSGVAGACYTGAGSHLLLVAACVACRGGGGCFYCYCCCGGMLQAASPFPGRCGPASRYCVCFCFLLQGTAAT